MQNEAANSDERPGHFIHPSWNPRVLEILSKAGWIKSGETLHDEVNHKSTIHIKPTKAGGERLRAALLLIRELDAINGNLNPFEAALVFRLARTYAPDQDNLEWPAELPPFTRE
jgi:DNA-binding MarR family transcriptional regulator